MGLLCCYDIIIDEDFNTDNDFINRGKPKNRGSLNRRQPGRHSAMSSQNTFAIKEDALLEDMCELADIEYEGDPTKMNKTDKTKMLKRLSKAPKTEGYFKSDKALNQFYENRHLNLPGTESQRKTHIGVVSRYSGIDSRLSITSRAHSHLNPNSTYQSRMSTNTPGGLLMSRMSQNYTSRLSQNVIQGAQASGDNSNTISNDRSRISKHHSRMSTTAEPYQPEAPEMKRASKSYALASDIINNKEESEKRFSVKMQMPKLFNMNNSIIADQRNSRFTSHSSSNQNDDSGKINQPINTLDDLKIKRGNSRHRRTSDRSRKSRSKNY